MEVAGEVGVGAVDDGVVGVELPDDALGQQVAVGDGVEAGVEVAQGW